MDPHVHPGENKHVEVFSFNDQGTRAFFPYPIPSPAGAFALRPYGRIGVLNDGIGLQEQLRWLLPGRLSSPIPLGLERVGAPAWSPNGRFVAYSGAVGLENVEGVRRSIASWRVFVSGGDLRSKRSGGRVVFEESPALAWSPNSRYLAAASVGRDRMGKLVLLEPTRRRQITVRRGDLDAVTWIDDRTLAVVRVAHRDQLKGGDYIELLDVGRAIARLTG